MSATQSINVVQDMVMSVTGIFQVGLSKKMLASVFLISLYGTPLAQITSYLALRSSLFGPVVQLIMIILSLTALTLS